LRGFYGANGSGVIAGTQMIFDCKKITIETRREKCDRYGLNDIVTKTPIFQRFYEKCSLVVRKVQPRSPFPKII